MKCDMMLRLLPVISLFCVQPSVLSFKLTTFPKDFNLTSLEERMTNLEQTIESRLAVTERVLGQLLTGQADENLETLDVLTLRSGSVLVPHYHFVISVLLILHI